MDEKDAVIFDVAVHASIRDGIRLSKAQAFPFKHNDISHLERRLERSSHLRNRFVCVESIYSTDGSIAPLDEICQLAKQYDAHVIVDEAHAVGVCGPYGAGLVMQKNLTSQVFAQVIVFSKALGVQGAIVLGNRTLKNTLINFSHSYIYTSALPFYSLAAINCSYELFPLMEKERTDLYQLVNLFKQEYSKATGSHIQSIPISGNENAKRMAEHLIAQGFDVRALLSPTIQRGCEILRINLHAYNQESELKALIKHLTITRENKYE
jgi:8-amino-7-oxononanoate synthase